ncbi:MAG TPA: hypothetical protein VFA05_09275 [Gaiellaceae bacterium]|nr:hypothetical protein [Gaiellaceae bacterium]
MEQEALERMATEARERARLAHDAALRARTRVAELSGRRGRVDVGGRPMEAVERRILAEERLAQIQVSLGEARRRSANAHERAARVDAAVGKDADAAHHHEAADRDRQLNDSAAPIG